MPRRLIVVIAGRRGPCASDGRGVAAFGGSRCHMGETSLDAGPSRRCGVAAPKYRSSAARALSSASSAVHMHHSSVAYRIDRISDLPGVDVRSSDGRHRGRTALLLWHLHAAPRGGRTV
ncbi:helix-turn-helix domain-containing protein [Spirillospora sp. NPDC046719]